MVHTPQKEPKTQKPRRTLGVPSFHLTSVESLEFIKDADKRKQIKKKKDTELDNIKKEAVKAHKIATKNKKSNYSLGSQAGTELKASVPPLVLN